MKSAILLIASLSMIISLSFAQTTTARIDGTVQDSSGAVVPNAKITAEETRTRISVTSESNGSGNFTFPTLQPGLYTLTVAASGFRTTVLKDIELATSSTVTEIVKLEIGQASESVAVEASSAVGQTTGSDHPFRHQPVSWRGIRLPAQYGPERERLL